MIKERQSFPRAVLCTAFAGQRHIASGQLPEVVRRTKPVVDRGETEPVLIFEDSTSEQIEVDFRGTMEQVLEGLTWNTICRDSAWEGAQKSSPGRPKLGVIPREVTLLPGHWDWLDDQPGGASSALRRLVHEAKKGDANRNRRSQEAVYRFMTVMAGNLPGFEEALRAFYRKDSDRFDELIKPWPKDVRSHVKKLVAAALSA
jgi:hypothetical protein